MKNDIEKEAALPRVGAEAPGAGPEPGDPALPPPVQEHLAKELRAAYQQTAEKPAFLGDPALPPAIEEKVEELALRERALMREKAHALGTEAVEAALEEVVSGNLSRPETSAKGPG